MKNLFELRETSRLVREAYKIFLDIPRTNQVTYGTKSLRTYGPKFWKSLPVQIKSFENLQVFRKKIKNSKNECDCTICEKQKESFVFKLLIFVSAFSFITTL